MLRRVAPMAGQPLPFCAWLGRLPSLPAYVAHHCAASKGVVRVRHSTSEAPYTAALWPRFQLVHEGGSQLPAGVVDCAQLGKSPPPFLARWTSGTTASRLRSVLRAPPPVVQACGAGGAKQVSVLDAMAGWGRDAATLAAAGATVDMSELNPLLCQLLLACLDDALGDAPTAAALGGRVRSLRQGDASEVLRGAGSLLWAASGVPAQEWDVVYIDGMFPPRGKSSAAVKADAQWLQALAAQGLADSLPLPHAQHIKEAVLASSLVQQGRVLQDAMQAACVSQGLETACAADAMVAPAASAAWEVARKRVVLKRPKGAETLQAPSLPRKPSFSVAARAVRFDVYVKP